MREMGCRRLVGNKEGRRGKWERYPQYPLIPVLPALAHPRRSSQSRLQNQFPLLLYRGTQRGGSPPCRRGRVRRHALPLTTAVVREGHRQAKRPYCRLSLGKASRRLWSQRPPSPPPQEGPWAGLSKQNEPHLRRHFPGQTSHHRLTLSAQHESSWPAQRPGTLRARRQSRSMPHLAQTPQQRRA